MSIISTIRTRNGLTLVEVVVSLAILGFLLAGLVLARGRLLTQWRDASDRLEAVKAADALLSDWMEDVQSIPRESQGRLSGETGLRWRSRIIDQPEMKERELDIVRVEIFRAEESDARPLLSVDIVLPENSTENLTTQNAE